jgi:patatin-like phospholipase/acyl hydrolase
MDSSKKTNAKRILSIDGGGIRGCLTLGYLQNIETIVRMKLGKEDAVLADYFDLIGGTSIR